MRIATILACLTTGARPQEPYPVEADAVVHAAADDALAGGTAATVRGAATHDAFGYPAPALSARDRRAFSVGNAFFKDNWVAAPSSAAGRDGLGPLFNARSCSACHLRDGRGRPPLEGEAAPPPGLLLRLCPEGAAADAPHPVYGGQLQDHAVPGFAAEGRIAIERELVRGRYADGAPFVLERPRYAIVDLGYGDLDGTGIGPRVASHMVGLGLLEAVPTEVLEALADPGDRDGDGVSGRVHWLDRDARRAGRFGWKATQPTVRLQAAAAFVHDMGITSPDFPDEVVTAAERAAAGDGELPSGGSPEIDEHKLDRVVFYSLALAVPAPRFPDETSAEAALVDRGRYLFGAAGCASCHTPELTTGAEAFHAAYANQRFRPYTDLLLHDMGEELADGTRAGDAAPAEWRTPPLWGIGLFETVNGHTRYLHDGRARDLEEAILWHGGEAARSRATWIALPRADREALLAFLRCL